MSPARSATDIAIVGAGIIGLSVAYYLVKNHRLGAITLIDSRDPMSLTSAQSGENYRNWWPHPVMTAFTIPASPPISATCRAVRGTMAVITR